MFETDTTRMRPGDLSEAVGLLTRLPVASEGGRGVKAAWAWPVAGALVAAIAGVAGWIALAVGLPPALASALVLGLMVILTGAMHEDGLADCADGFWGGWAVECRLEIMKDSRIGTYGVIALVLSLLMRWSAIAALAEAGTLIAPLVAAAALSRFPMVALMWRLPSVRRGRAVRQQRHPRSGYGGAVGLHGRACRSAVRRFCRARGPACGHGRGGVGRMGCTGEDRRADWRCAGSGAAAWRDRRTGRLRGDPDLTRVRGVSRAKHARPSP